MKAADDCVDLVHTSHFPRALQSINHTRMAAAGQHHESLAHYIHHDRLIGAILIGDKSEFLEFRTLIENKIELSEKRLQLLRSGKATEPVIGKLVCSCNNVGEGNLINKIKEGCKDHLQLCQLTGAGMGCGSCRPEVKAILDHEVDLHPVKLFV